VRNDLLRDDLTDLSVLRTPTPLYITFRRYQSRIRPASGTCYYYVTLRRARLHPVAIWKN
jgi:hypothetical protein